MELLVIYNTQILNIELDRTCHKIFPLHINFGLNTEFSPFSTREIQDKLKASCSNGFSFKTFNPPKKKKSSFVQCGITCSNINTKINTYKKNGVIHTSNLCETCVKFSAKINVPLRIFEIQISKKINIFIPKTFLSHRWRNL